MSEPEFKYLPPMIGITGKAGSGKDTVADFIVAEAGGYKYSLAEPVKRMLAVLGIDLALPGFKYGKEEVIPALGKSYRQLMQLLGTEWGRNMVNPKIWMRVMARVLEDRGSGTIIPESWRVYSKTVARG